MRLAILKKVSKRLVFNLLGFQFLYGLVEKTKSRGKSNGGFFYSSNSTELLQTFNNLESDLIAPCALNNFTITIETLGKVEISYFRNIEPYYSWKKEDGTKNLIKHFGCINETSFTIHFNIDNEIKQLPPDLLDVRVAFITINFSIMNRTGVETQIELQDILLLEDSKKVKIGSETPNFKTQGGSQQASDLWKQAYLNNLTAVPGRTEIFDADKMWSKFNNLADSSGVGSSAYLLFRFVF